MSIRRLAFKMLKTCILRSKLSNKFSFIKNASASFNETFRFHFRQNWSTLFYFVVTFDSNLLILLLHDFSKQKNYHQR